MLLRERRIADAVGDISEKTVRRDKSKAATSQNYEVAAPPTTNQVVAVTTEPATRSKGKDGRQG